MSNERIPDGLLLRRYREGDESSFAELVRRHGRLVHATCLRETGDAALAEDAAQGVFLLLSRRSFGEESSLAGWLHNASRLVSRNLVRGEVRRRRREQRAVEEYTEPETAWKALAPQVDAALSALKPGDREAVLLRYASEMSLAEVGSTLGIGENAARMRVSRALDKMRRYLRRAGVGIGAALLATLLSTRLADASPVAYSPLPTRAPKATQRGSLAGGLGSTAVYSATVILAIATILSVTWWIRSPKAADVAEVRRLLGSTVGPWQGTLEFADDASGQRTTTGVSVRVTRDASGFIFTSTYPGYSRVDTTTFALQSDKRIRIENGGAAASHKLDGLYLPFRNGSGLEFRGVSPSLMAEVRLRLVVSGNRLQLSEEYRRDQGEYRFRNQYSLTRP